MHYGITLWAYLSEPLVKDNVYVQRKKLQYLMLKSLDRTLLLRTCCGDVYGNIPHEENR